MPAPALVRTKQLVIPRVLGLPTSVVSRLAGSPVELDGQRLAPEIQLLLRLRELAREPVVEELPLEEARRALRQQSRVAGGQLPIGAARDLVVAGADGSLTARLYTPAALLGATALPTLLFLHGGGMIYGDLESHDAPCRFLAEAAGVQVLAVDYRLAPEHPFPAPVDDAIAAYRWLVENTDEVNADPTRLAVGGDSAGGNLAAVTAVAAAEEGLPLAFQLLVYPVTDFAGRSRSRALFEEGFYLTSRFMDGATAAYFTPGADPADTRASVLRRTSFPGGVAPAYVATAGFDPLRDEGEAYGALLAEHGVDVEVRRFPGMIHGFLNMTACGPEARAHLSEIADRLRAALAFPGTAPRRARR